MLHSENGTLSNRPFSLFPSDHLYADIQILSLVLTFWASLSNYLLDNLFTHLNRHPTSPVWHVQSWTPDATMPAPFSFPAFINHTSMCPAAQDRIKIHLDTSLFHPLMQLKANPKTAIQQICISTYHNQKLSTLQKWTREDACLHEVSVPEQLRPLHTQ